MVVINRLFFDNYIFRVNACEICSSVFPDQVVVGDQKYDIFEIKRPEDDPYLLMEVVGMPSGKNMKLIRIRDEFTISLGRSEDCDVRINDSSISYKHAIIRYEYGI